MARELIWVAVICVAAVLTNFVPGGRVLVVPELFVALMVLLYWLARPQAADLAPSGEVADVGPGAGAGVDPFAGRNLHFGIREHGMGSIANGCLTCQTSVRRRGSAGASIRR